MARPAATKFNGKQGTAGWEALPVLLRLVRATASGKYTELSMSTRVGVAAVIIYLVSALDLVPDFIPVAGLVDDLVIQAWFVHSIKNNLDMFVEWEKRQKDDQDGQDAKDGSQNSGHRSENADEGSQNATTRNAPTMIQGLWT